MVRNMIKMQKNAALIIQATYKMKDLRKKFLLMKNAAIRIQVNYFIYLFYFYRN